LSKAEEAARAADASIKYWLGEAERTNKEAVDRVGLTAKVCTCQAGDTPLRPLSRVDVPRCVCVGG